MPISAKLQDKIDKYKLNTSGIEKLVKESITLKTTDRIAEARKREAQQPSATDEKIAVIDEQLKILTARQTTDIAEREKIGALVEQLVQLQKERAILDRAKKEIYRRPKNK